MTETRDAFPPIKHQPTTTYRTRILQVVEKFYAGYGEQPNQGRASHFRGRAPGADDVAPAGVGQQLGEDVPAAPRVTPGKRRAPRAVPGAMFLPSNWRLHEAQQPRQDMPEQQIEIEREEQQDDAALTSLLPSVLPTPAPPSAAEYQSHQLTHLPFASWCPHCVSGKAKETPHRRVRVQTEEHIAVPRLEADFLIVDQDRTALTVVDSTTTFLQVIMLRMGKAASDSYALRSFSAFLRFLPYLRMILQVDQEPALLSLARRAVALSGKEIDVTVTPKGSKGSLGVAERAHSTVMSQTRTLLARCRAQYGQQAAVEDLLRSWALRHAAWLLNRFQVHKPSNQTSFQLVFGRTWRGNLLGFGETCLIKVDPDRLVSKFAQRWEGTLDRV